MGAPLEPVPCSGFLAFYIALILTVRVGCHKRKEHVKSQALNLYMYVDHRGIIYSKDSQGLARESTQCPSSHGHTSIDISWRSDSVITNTIYETKEA